MTDIMVSVKIELLDAMNNAINSTDASAVDRFKAAVDCHIRYHAETAREVFIGNSELRSLNNEDLEEVLAKRAEYERLLQKLVKDVAKATGAGSLDAKCRPTRSWPNARTSRRGTSPVGPNRSTRSSRRISRWLCGNSA